MAIPAHPRTVVTGAGSGLGRAFCRELARRGARILASDLDMTGVAGTIDELANAEVHAVHCDVTKLADVERLAEEADRRFGGADLVVNNAGVAAGGPIGEVPHADWEWVLGVVLWGPVNGCHVFVPRFRAQGHGHVLNVASAAGLLAGPMMGPYNVGKAGVVALSETLFAELHGSGVGVSVLCPTFFQTNIVAAARMTGDPSARDLAQHLMARSSVQADHVARIALDGCARDALYILPHADGRWLWRLKRASPRRFHRLVPKLLALRAGRRA